MEKGALHATVRSFCCWYERPNPLSGRWSFVFAYVSKCLHRIPFSTQYWAPYYSIHNIKRVVGYYYLQRKKGNKTSFFICLISFPISIHFYESLFSCHSWKIVLQVRSSNHFEGLLQLEKRKLLHSLFCQTLLIFNKDFFPSLCLLSKV